MVVLGCFEPLKHDGKMYARNRHHGRPFYAFVGDCTTLLSSLAELACSLCRGNAGVYAGSMLQSLTPMPIWQIEYKTLRSSDLPCSLHQHITSF